MSSVADCDDCRALRDSTSCLLANGLIARYREESSRQCAKRRPLDCHHRSIRRLRSEKHVRHAQRHFPHSFSGSLVRPSTQYGNTSAGGATGPFHRRCSDRCAEPAELRELRRELVAREQRRRAVDHVLGRLRAGGPRRERLGFEVVPAADEEDDRLLERPAGCGRSAWLRLYARISMSAIGEEAFTVVSLFFWHETEVRRSLRTLGSKVAKASSSGTGLASMRPSTATVTAACCSPASRFLTPATYLHIVRSEQPS